MTPAGRKVTMIAAVAENGVIGNGPDIPWRIPGEQKVFKERTLGTVLIMGRTTHESIGRPLPGRTTIVLTRDPLWSAEGVLLADSVPAALELADSLLDSPPAGRQAAVDSLPAGRQAAVDSLPAGRQVTIGGGAAVYEAALPYADEQVITEIPLSPEGDVHYPAFSRSRWRESSRDPRGGFTVVTYERVVACGGS